MGTDKSSCRQKNISLNARKGVRFKHKKLAKWRWKESLEMSQGASGVEWLHSDKGKIKLKNKEAKGKSFW